MPVSLAAAAVVAGAAVWSGSSSGQVAMVRELLPASSYSPEELNEGEDVGGVERAERESGDKARRGHGG